MFGPVVPRLPSRDLARTRAFYEEHLGFLLTGCHPDQDRPTWIELTRGEARVEFFHDDGEDGPPGGPTPWAIQVPVPDVDALHGALAPVADVLWGPESFHYGWREFAIADPDGYQLIFGQPAPLGPNDGQGA